MATEPTTLEILMGILQGWLLPAVVALALAIVLPLRLARKFPQTMAGLALNLAVSGAALFVLATAYFAASYAMRAPGVLAALTGAPGGWWHFLRLGLLSGLWWGPVVLLMLATRPAQWRPEL